MGRYSSHIILALAAFFLQVSFLCWGATSSLGCIEAERLALLDFKDSLINGSLNRLSSWTGKDCCTWKGIGCNNDTRNVIKLDLRNPVHADSNGYFIEVSNQLKAKAVNSSLLELKYLEHLDLSWNDFMGSPVPTFFGSLQRLRYLNLSNARFNGVVPDQLGILSRLHDLDLSSGPSEYDFQLSVRNLQWLSRLSSLRRLDLSWLNLQNASDLVQVLNKLPFLVHLRLSSCGLGNHVDLFHDYVNSTFLEHFDVSVNKLQGPIPNIIQHMSALKFLDLSTNILDSTIPLWLADLKSLVHLNLGYNNLSGEIPNALGNLAPLLVLDLSFNSFVGGIPSSLWNLCSLKVLDLTMNRLNETIPDPSKDASGCIGSSLEKLSLRWNKVRSPLPDWFSQFENLKILDLANNSFYGPIPASYGRLSNLRMLDFSHNHLNGTVPESFGQLSLLEKLLMSTNSLRGTMSELHFANLSRLEELDISVNSLVLQVNPDWVPPFQLNYINMRSCIIGPQFPAWLQLQKRITTLYLSNTSISDVLPQWLPNLRFSYLDLSFNHIRGRLPTFLKPDSVYMNLYLSSNKIEGPLTAFPSILNRLDLTDNLISGPIPLDIGNMTPTLDNLLLSGNQITGSIPESLCKINTLRVLDLSKNRLYGDIPDCWSDFKILVVLDFSANNFSGVIPISLGNATSLKSLHLSNNTLQGELPSSLRNCTSMVILDSGENGLSGKIPRWIGENMLSLEILRLRSNKFDGTIPLEICRLAELQVLDLAHNNLSGTIPTCFGNLRGMTTGVRTSDIGIYLWSTTYGENMVQFMKGRQLEYTKTLKYLINMDLSSNTLMGTIPEELAILIRLRGLNLSNNQLTGNMPAMIGNIRSLESLDLSRNQLSGSIPLSMSALPSLSHLNLSYNDLSGRIPSGNQLQTLDDPSIYIGNSELCGFPLPKCASNEPPPSPKEVEDEGNGSEMKWFYISMSAGYVTGLWGVLGVMLYKKNWRDAYFNFVDDVKEKTISAFRKKEATSSRRSRSNHMEWSW
ncbi:receptor-like protein EIX2 [Juglans microcarpa x Juglans regia]|uniref:receptor-like protein EIX2 n=1 Tax=Juglans microcarpa x Juglans regia TaxID=2249226 RepID=UPI001B7F1FE9|nr:receptor-like protein EIX2 [Juglans microcarpa x Juglans regia]